MIQADEMDIGERDEVSMNLHRNSIIRVDRSQNKVSDDYKKKFTPRLYYI